MEKFALNRFPTHQQIAKLLKDAQFDEETSFERKVQWEIMHGVFVESC